MGGRGHLFEIPADHPGADRGEVKDHGVVDPFAESRGSIIEDVSQDGKQILGRARDSSEIWSKEWTTPKSDVKILVKSGEAVFTPGFSPDARWIVYEAGYKDGEAIYVQSASGPGVRTQIAASNGVPLWRGDGKEIVIADRRGIWSVTVDGTGDRLHFAPPKLLFSGIRWPAGYGRGNWPLAVSRDGSRIYLLQVVSQPPDAGVIHVRMGWPGG